MKKELLISLMLLVIGVGAFLFMNRPKEISTTDIQQTPTTSQVDATTPAVTVSTGVTIEEIAKHTSASSCWMAINGNVYDVTKYITNHPGGDTILLGCGKDATDLFTGIAAMGKRHSSKAQSALSQFLVGSLENL